MKKLLLTSLLIMCIGVIYGQHDVKGIDCNKFYVENFDTISVKGIIWSKEVTDNYYLFSVKCDNGEDKYIRLLKNVKTSQIYNFASWGSDILKVGGERNLHIRVKYLDGSMQGKIFKDFCD